MLISNTALAISLGDLKKTLEDATEEIKKEIENNDNQNNSNKSLEIKTNSNSTTKTQSEQEVVANETKKTSDNLNINLSYCRYDKESTFIYTNVKSVSDKVIEISDYNKQNEPSLTMKWMLIEKSNNQYTNNKDMYFFENIKNGQRVWIIPETREMTYRQWDWFKCPDEEAVELIKNDNFKYKNYEEYLVFKERESTKDIVFDNYKGTMKCMLSSSSLEVKDSKIVDFKTNRFIVRDIGDWKIDLEKSEPKNLLVHVKAINVVANAYEYFVFDFKNNFVTHIDFSNSKIEDKCQKKLEL